MARTFCVFANPGAGRARDALHAAGRALDRMGIAYRQVRPATAADLRDGIRRVADRVDAVVLAGGDGTVNAALPALVDTAVPLGVLPLGTANDFARTLGIALDPEAAVQVLTSGAVRGVDLGQVNGRLFCNVAHVGLGAHAHSHGPGAGGKRRWRALVYPMSVLRALRRLRPFRVEISVDGGPRTHLRTLHLSVGNGRFYGGGVPVEVTAAIDDGLLDAYCVPPRRGLSLAHAVWDVWRGGLPGSAVWRAKGQEMVVHTRRPRRIMADGEYIARTPAAFNVLVRGLSCIVPAADAGPGLTAETAHEPDR